MNHALFASPARSHHIVDTDDVPTPETLRRINALPPSANITRLAPAPEQARVVHVALSGGFVAKYCASTRARYPSVCAFPGRWRPVQDIPVITS